MLLPKVAPGCQRRVCVSAVSGLDIQKPSPKKVHVSSESSIGPKNACKLRGSCHFWEMRPEKCAWDCSESSLSQRTAKRWSNQSVRALIDLRRSSYAWLQLLQVTKRISAAARRKPWAGSCCICLLTCSFIKRCCQHKFGHGVDSAAMLSVVIRLVPIHFVAVLFMLVCFGRVCSCVSVAATLLLCGIDWIDCNSCGNDNFWECCDCIVLWETAAGGCIPYFFGHRSSRGSSECSGKKQLTKGGYLLTG